MNRALARQGQKPLKTFRESVQKTVFTLTAELALNRASTAEEVIQQAMLLAGSVDAIQVTDNPDGRVHMSPLAVASLLLNRGIDPVPLLSCRDRNRIALESELLGMAGVGVSSVLLMRGEKLLDDHQPSAKPVFDLTGIELIKMARRLGDYEENPKPADLFIGALATVFNPKPKWRPRRMPAKATAGAQFIQTRLCFDMQALSRYMARLVEHKQTWQFSIMVGIAPLPSAVSARWLRDNLRGTLMPEETIKRLEQARDPEQEGVRICAELLQQLAEIPGVSGASLMTPGEPSTIPAAISAAALSS